MNTSYSGLGMLGLHQGNAEQTCKSKANQVQINVNPGEREEATAGLLH